MERKGVGNPRAMALLSAGKEVEFGGIALGLHGEAALLRVGRLGSREVGDLRSALLAVQERAVPRLVVDMRSCRFICSRAISEFFTLLKQEKASEVWSCSFTLFGIPEGTAFSLRTSGLLNLVRSAEGSVEQALSA